MNQIEIQERHKKWEALVIEQENSGLSQVKFCKENNLVLSNFVYYRSKIKSADKQNKNPALFSEISIKKQNTFSPTTEIKIILPNGFQCVLPSTAEALQIKQLIEVLLLC